MHEWWTDLAAPRETAARRGPIQVPSTFARDRLVRSPERAGSRPRLLQCFNRARGHFSRAPIQRLSKRGLQRAAEAGGASPVASLEEASRTHAGAPVRRSSRSRGPCGPHRPLRSASTPSSPAAAPRRMGRPPQQTADPDLPPREEPAIGCLPPWARREPELPTIASVSRPSVFRRRVFRRTQRLFDHPPKVP
jgi:hypothetical protein